MNAIPQTGIFSCPCCGNHLGAAAPLEHVKDAITAPALRTILDALSRPVGRAVMRDVILDRVYGSRSDGGPDTAVHVLQAQVSQLRRKIEPFGWTITVSRGGAGNLAQWRLIPTTKSA